MKLAIVSLSLICLVLPGQASNCFASSSSKKQFDFDQLDKWVTKHRLAQRDAQANVAFVKGNMNQLTNGQVRRAAELLVAIVEAKKCDTQLLESLKQMAKETPFLNGKPRLVSIIGPSFERLNGLCGPLIDQQAASFYEHSLDHHLKEFIESFLRPTGFQISTGVLGDAMQAYPFHWYVANINDPRLNPSLDGWARHLHQFARNDEKAQVHVREYNKNNGKSKIVERRANFDYAFNVYLVEPCKQLTSGLDDTLKSLYGLAQVQCSKAQDYREFILKRSNTVHYLSFAYKICSSLLGLNRKQIDQLFKQSFESNVGWWEKPKRRMNDAIRPPFHYRGQFQPSYI